MVNVLKLSTSPRVCVALASLLLAACDRAPDCQFAGEGDQAVTAGCLVLHEEQLLLIEARGNKWSPPGGSVRPGESAQCGAERETWEETNVAVVARDLAMTFENGFHLYWCDPVGVPEPEVISPLEVMDVGFFGVESFAERRWRYPYQGNLYYRMVNERLGR